MVEKIIGRKPEQEALSRLYASGEAEFLALYGRRRVGKTFLIRNTFADAHLYFELTGQRESSLGEQLDNFADVFGDTLLGGRRLSRPRSPRGRLQGVSLQGVSLQGVSLQGVLQGVRPCNCQLSIS